MKKVTRLMSAILSAALLASVVTVAPFSVGATETDQDVSVAYSEESAEAIPELSSEQATEPPIEETTVESHIIETTVAQTVEETSAVPKTQNSPKSIESVGASAGESVSANGIENKINTLSQAFANAEITHFTNNGEAAGSEESNCYLPNINDSLSKAGLPTGAEAVSQGASAGYSCYGFASYVFWYLYGSNFRYAPTASTPSYGDLLEFNGAHYAIYLGERNGNYYVYDSNWDFQCTIQMHEIPKFWNTPVTIYHASNYAQVFDSEPPKTGGHVDFQRGTTMQGATPINTFVLKYTASDNIGVSRVYAHVWEFGQTEDQARTYEGALSGQNVTVTIPQSEMPESTYSIECYAEDATGNRASIGVKRTYFPIYKVIEDTGTYQVTADTAPVRHSPYEKINGKSTDSGQYHKGLKVSITGYYINSYGNKWYQLDNSNWIYSGNIKKCFQWSDVWNAINPFVGKNEKFYYFSDQAIMAGETVSSKSGASVGAGTDEDSAVGAQNYIRVTGTCPEYYSVNGGSSTYYTITFDANGGSLSTTSKTVVSGTAMGYSPTPYRLGYQFDGWFTAAEEGVQYTSSTVVNGNITLYAHWTRIVLLEGYCGDNLYFILYADGGLEFTGYGDMTSHPWTNKYSKRVYEVSMPQEVTSLCSSAFEGCQYMLPFTLPNLTIIPSSAFKECTSLESFYLPNSVTSIGMSAFENCVSLSTANLPNSLEELGALSFSNTSIESIEIPKSLNKSYVRFYNDGWVTSGSGDVSYSFDGKNYNISQGPFLKCDKLKTVTFEDGITKIPVGTFTGCTGIESIVMPETITSIEAKAFKDCLRLTTIHNSNSITSIGMSAFENCVSLSTANLPNSLEELGALSFSNTSIESIEIPKSLNKSYVRFYNDGWVTSGSGDVSYSFDGKNYNISQGPFLKCDKLKTVTFEDGITKIPVGTFTGCTGIESITIPNTITLIEARAFEDCLRLNTVLIADTVTKIDDRAFENCINLSNTNLPKALETLGNQAFAKTSITSVVIPKTLNKASYSTTINFTVDNVIYSVPTGPFYMCQDLENVSFEDGIKNIPDNLFAGCIGIKNLDIPVSINKIGNSVFRGCLNLKSICFNNEYIEFGTYVFYNCISLDSIEIPTQTTKIPSYMFYNCISIHKVTGLDSITQIDERSFYNCNSLEVVNFPQVLTNISDYAFYQSGLTYVEIPDNVTTIGSYAFCNTPIEGLKLSKTISTIGTYAFSNCDSLKSVELPARIKTVGANAFSNCDQLDNIIINSGVSTISSNAFQNCIALKTVSIPSTVKTLGQNAFQNCQLLDSVIIEDYSIKTLSNSVFKDCPNIEKVILPKGLETISSSAFANDTGLSEVEIPESVTSIATNAFSYPDNMTVYGYTDSYAKRYCDEKGINFVDNHVLSQGIALDQTPCASEDYIIMDLGETNEVKFDVYPLNSNDVISLTSDNTRVTINGMHITSKSAGDSVITATATSGVEYTFTIHNRSVKNVSVKTLPENLRITQGNELDLSGFELLVNYNDNSNAVTDNYTISGFDKDTIGVQTVTVSYVGTNGSTYKTTFNVEVVDPRGNLTGISIKQYPRKLKYVKYDALDLEGLIVVENYDSGLEIEITDYKVTGYNALKLGKQTIKITKGEYTVTFEVEVTEKPVYAIGDTNLDGIVSIRDVTAIQRHIAELELFSDEQLALADTNGDGEINISDATHLQMYLAEYDVVLGKQ